MPFENGLYDEILKDYERLRMMRKREREQRLSEVYAKDAELEVLDIAIQTTGAQAMMQILENPSASKDISKKMQEDILRMQNERKKRLIALGFSPDYTEIVYDCPVCEDTGYADGNLCDCLKEKAVRAVRFASDIAPILAVQNFHNFNINLYAEQNRELMEENYSVAKAFVRDFETGKDNLFLYGSAGCGKTFLSSCIANALIEKNVQVVYKSAGRLFNEYLDYVFNRNNATEAKKEIERVLEAEALIIDDLGTEAVNQHTISYLFRIINERGIRGKRTIISTNLTPKDISATYTERISSRIFEQYVLMEFPLEDIRLKKAFLENK